MCWPFEIHYNVPRNTPIRRGETVIRRGLVGRRAPRNINIPLVERVDWITDHNTGRRVFPPHRTYYPRYLPNDAIMHQHQLDYLPYWPSPYAGGRGYGYDYGPYHHGPSGGPVGPSRARTRYTPRHSWNSYYDPYERANIQVRRPSGGGGGGGYGRRNSYYDANEGANIEFREPRC